LLGARREKACLAAAVIIISLGGAGAGIRLLKIKAETCINFLLRKVKYLNVQFMSSDSKGNIEILYMYVVPNYVQTKYGEIFYFVANPKTKNAKLLRKNTLIRQREDNSKRICVV
jgi:hypothetical protein